MVEKKAAVDGGIGRITEVKIRCSLVVALHKFSQPGRSLLRVQRYRTDWQTMQRAPALGVRLDAVRDA